MHDFCDGSGGSRAAGVRPMKAPSRWIAGSAVLALILAGCAGTSSSGAATEEPSASGLGPPVATAATVAPGTTSSPATGGAGSFYYGSIREFSTAAKGIALVRVTNVGDLQYNTVDGSRPAEGTPLTGSISVGRIVEVSLVRLVKGSWLAGQTARYWQPGGTIGADSTPSEGFMGLPRPEQGSTMVAFLAPVAADLDPTDAELPMDIIALFPVNQAGRVLTPDPHEQVQADDLNDAVD